MDIRKIFFSVLLVGAVVCYFYGQNIWFKINAEGYQAVFLDNGQVYFGKISASGRFIKLTDVYYLQATDLLQQAGSKISSSDPNQKLQLIKLGSELHGPTDAMYIEKDKILFWENMKDDGKVVEAIKKYKSP